MQRKIFHRVHLLIFAAFFLLVWRAHANADDDPTTERKRVIAELSNHWKQYLGDIDCSDEFLFQRMLYLWPQSPEQFQKFEHVKLAEWNRLDYDMWLGSHFKGDLLEKLKNPTPSAYYLRKEKNDESLLLYQAQLDGIKISLLENYTVSLITFTPEGFDLSKGITRIYLEKILSEWLNLGEQTDAVKSLLKRQVYHQGVIFANNQERSHILLTRAWQDDILCFLTEKGISFLLFKMNADRALMGIPTGPEWLDKGKGLLDIEAPDKPDDAETATE